MTQLPTTPQQSPDYHWSPTNQRTFLEHLAIIGSVTLAAKHVGMSARAAYDLKLRRDGAAFKLGWAAAVLIARERLGDDLLERAIHGYDEEYVRTPADENGEVRIRRHRIDSRLGMEYLKRLDRMADAIAENAGELRLAQIIMGDWEAFLDRLAPAEGEGGVAAVACWLAGRDNRFNPLSGLWEKPEDCEVAQISAGLEENATPELTPEEEAAAMKIWYCDYSDAWRTNFPPPDDFDGDEDGSFGDIHYERQLSEEEEEVRLHWLEAEVAPLRKAGEAARKAFFNLPEKAEDFTQRRGDAEDGAALVPPGEPGAMDDLCTEAMEPRAVERTDSAELCASACNRSTQSENDAVEEEATAPSLRPPSDATIRVVHCAPQINHVARGMIPPHIARELGIELPYGDARRRRSLYSAATAQPTAQRPFDTRARLWLTRFKHAIKRGILHGSSGNFR